MLKIKSEKHHWWPQCVSKHWAGEDDKVGWLKPDGTSVRLPPSVLGAVGNGHHIKLGKGDEVTPWDQSYERAFDNADNSFPGLIEWLAVLDRGHVKGAQELRQRFVPQPATDEQLLRMTECAVSLAVRGPMNRHERAYLAERSGGPLTSTARNAVIGLNMRGSQRVISDSIGSSGKFVAVYSSSREFVFGDGFFHNIGFGKMAPYNPKIFVPITPEVCILVCQPRSYMVKPRLTTLLLEDEEVDVCNQVIQVYSKDALFFRSQQPVIDDAFRQGVHLRYENPDNPIDTLISNIPGVSASAISLPPGLDNRC